MKKIPYDGSIGFVQNQLLRYWMFPNVIRLQNNCLSWGLSAYHGSYSNRGFHDGWQESTIGIVTEIENINNGQKVKNDEYMGIYKALAREIKKHLVYSSFYIFPEGKEVENTKWGLMTQGVVDQYMQGVKYVNRPGRRIKDVKVKKSKA